MTKTKKLIEQVNSDKLATAETLLSDILKENTRKLIESYKVELGSVLYESDDECDCDDEDECDCDEGDLEEKSIKKVVRGGKLVKKVICGPGKKAEDGQCVAIKSTEKLARKRGARLGGIARKRDKAGQIKALRKHKKSEKKAKAFGLRS